MDIIPAIRELCRGEHGFEDMFDKAKVRVSSQNLRAATVMPSFLKSCCTAAQERHLLK